MRPIERIDNFLRLLGEAWKRQGQDLRFTQFLFNNGIDPNQMHHCEEKEILRILDKDIAEREYTYWGTYGKSGKDPVKYVLIKDLEKEHIEAILLTQNHISPEMRELLKTELTLK